jgi:CheY-like chemotaxis protein
MEAIRWLHDRDRVLLVDDEVALTNLWRDVLESTGRYIVQEENSAERAIQAAREFRPHLIFMDRDIHGTDGGELAAELRVDAELGSVPIVFVTGSVSRREAALHGLFGGMPTLAKPFTSEALVRLAGVVLDRHRRPWSGNDLRSVGRDVPQGRSAHIPAPLPAEAA